MGELPIYKGYKIQITPDSKHTVKIVLVSKDEKRTEIVDLRTIPDNNPIDYALGLIDKLTKE